MSEQLPNPFTRELDAVACYESRGHQEALARLTVALEKRLLGVLTGEVGCGKSAVLRRLVRGMDPMKVQVLYLSRAGLKPREFYAELLRQVDEEAPFGVAKAKRLWEEVVTRRHMQGERQLMVILDEAHELSEAMLLELRFAMSHHMDACSLYPILLAGQPELRKTLRLKKYESIAQRVGVQYHLMGLSKEETAGYIRHQLKTAQVERPIFAESAMQLVFAASQGIPRVVNLICGQAMMEAERKELEVVEENLISKVLADMDRQRGTTG